MSNFIETYKKGRQGKSFGLTTGIKGLDKAINGLQRKTSIGLAAAPKCGKTTLCDFSFVIHPYLQCLALGILGKVEWIYFSYEIDRVSKEFKFAAFFMAHDHGIYNYVYKEKTYAMSDVYLKGQQLHENPDGTLEVVQVSDEHFEILKKVYDERIIPLFGEYAADGTMLKAGKIHIIEEPENPTGINKFLLHHAATQGKFLYTTYWTVDDQGNRVQRQRVSGYVPNDPDKFTIVITDHIRKLRRERGFSMKENIDKYLEYSTIIRNLCAWTFIHVIHSNRNLANVDRLRMAGEQVFPTADDCKDSGNPAEECTIFMTLFNPGDEKYNLKKHMGVELKENPHYRSIHITESRNTKCPAHIQTNMYGGISTFTPLFNNQKTI